MLHRYRVTIDGRDTEQLLNAVDAERAGLTDADRVDTPKPAPAPPPKRRPRAKRA